jgi:hypothetical protein
VQKYNTGNFFDNWVLGYFACQSAVSCGPDEHLRAEQGRSIWGVTILLAAHDDLLGLMLIFTGIEFINALTWFSILPVMILARSGGDKLARWWARDLVREWP